jgi:hypothetical protein
MTVPLSDTLFSPLSNRLHNDRHGHDDRRRTRRNAAIFALSFNVTPTLTLTGRSTDAARRSVPRGRRRHPSAAASAGTCRVNGSMARLDVADRAWLNLGSRRPLRIDSLPADP